MNRPRRQNPFPGGLLVISRDGRVLEAPAFFIDALEMECEESAESVYHLFDPRRTPSLKLARIYRRPNGVIEYHVVVLDPERGVETGFRYWHVSPAGSEGQAPISFYIVDDSPTLRSQEWLRRRLRRNLQRRVRGALIEHFRERLTSLRLLAEVMRDRPEAAVEAAGRLLLAIDGLEGGLDEVLRAIPEPDAVDDDARVGRYIGLKEVPHQVATWADGLTPIRVHIGKGIEGGGGSVALRLLDLVVHPVVQNAVEATPPGLSVFVDLERIAPAQLRVVVEDGGVGMDDYVLEHVGQLFFTTKAGHMGLGLARAQEVLQECGGHWMFQSQPQRGTRVTIVLPVVPESDEAG